MTKKAAQGGLRSRRGPAARGGFASAHLKRVYFCIADRDRDGDGVRNRHGRFPD